jgi:alcohol dehydrogenase class IV
VAEVQALAERARVRPALFADVQANPTGANVEAGVAALERHQADGLIALGGGSAIDCAKAIALLAACGAPLWRFAWPGHAAAQGERVRLPILAIPTAAGTGAEVEPSALITDSALPAKRALLHPGMMPKLVIADPALTISLPPALTAATGMDALSHSLEALCVANYHPMADSIAISAIVLIGRWLPVAIAEPDNIDARSHMLAAAIMGAAAFGKGLGAMHALSHAIGALKGHHHGLINAVLMPFVLAYNRPAIAEAMARLATALHLTGDPLPAVQRWVLDLRRRVGTPETVTALGLARSDFAQVAALAAQDICAGTNPVPVDALRLRAILEAAA